MDDPVRAYAEAVVDGEILAGKLVRQACERHLRDLEAGGGRGLRFDLKAACRAINFFPTFLTQSKGEWGGAKLTLQPWEAFIVGSVFGWKRADGKRRFRTAYIEIARKNGKSAISSGVGLYLLIADGEPGAEIFSAATMRDQARITHEEAVRMVKASPELRRQVVCFKDNLNVPATNSKYEPLGADADSLDGLNIHGAIVDELHAHKSRALWDVLDTATAARRQPLIWAITTAGYDRHSICWEQHDYAVKVLDGVFEAETFFGYVATIDEGDSWLDPRVWGKANPNLGISVKLDDLERKADKAKQLPSAQNAFKRLHLNVWTENSERWLDLALWDATGDTPIDADDLLGRPCWAGLDLSSTTDITALVLLFRDDDGGYTCLCYFWVPEDNLRRRAERDRVPYDVWADQGYIEPTAGNVVDYDVVRARINELGERFSIQQIAIDRWNATQITTQLAGDGFDVVPMGQGFASMTAPTKELEKIVLGRMLRHGGNPVLRWMASNVAVEQDAAGNMKPSKAKSSDRIDGIAGLVMAIDRTTRSNGGTSVYESRGVLTLGGDDE